MFVKDSLSMFHALPEVKLPCADNCCDISIRRFREAGSHCHSPSSVSMVRFQLLTRKQTQMLTNAKSYWAQASAGGRAGFFDRVASSCLCRAGLCDTAADHWLLVDESPSFSYSVGLEDDVLVRRILIEDRKKLRKGWYELRNRC